MRTIGKHWPADTPYGVALCDLCGVKWRRSDLQLDRNGFLVCPDDVGPDRVPYARAPHIQNNEGTGPSAYLPGNYDDEVDPLPVLLL